MFKLNSTLSGHELDVRSVAAAGPHTIVSALRDATVRSWTTGASVSGLDESLVVFHSPENSFINAVAYVDESNCTGESLVASGGKDCIVFLSPAHPDPTASDMAKYNLVGHENNICALSYTHNTLASGSWDATARVWDLATMLQKYVLRGHSASVWDVKIVDATNDIYLTASADGTIRRWKGDKETRQYKGHLDVVRKLLLLPNGTFASCSNDSTIIIWDLESGNILHRLQGHTSFIYDLGSLPNGDLVSCSEDRSVRVWRNNVPVQAITLPCVSVWCLATLENGDFVVGGSDKLLRVFTNDPARFAPAAQLQEFQDAVQNSAIAEQSMDDLKKTDVPGYEALEMPGKQEGSTIMVKNAAGTIEAHQWSGGDWVKIGDVVGSTGGSDLKKTFDGKEYDFVFDVDIEDGAPPLKLPFNHTDNPYETADKFLAANELPASYREEVVQFIFQNTGGAQLDLAPAKAENPYADKLPLPLPDAHTGPKIIPEKSYFLFKDFKVEQLCAGFSKLNGSQSKQFSEDEVQAVAAKLASLNSSDAVSLLTETVPRILSEWDTKAHLIGFDLMRVCIPRVTTVDFLRPPGSEVAVNVYDELTKGLDASADNIALFMMILKTFNNVIGTVLFAQLFMTADDSGATTFSDHLVSIFEMIEVVFKKLSDDPGASSLKHYPTAATSLATLIYNLSVYQISTDSFASHPETARPVTTFASVVGQSLVLAGSEAAYRLCIAYGNFRYIKAFATKPKWLETVARQHGSEARIRSLLAEINT